ncbi:MAG: S8/S53 family peptidase, partial [Anaerolineales bacterium]|nr:S8/S53 family peptidase [Anaerolineales bacterium]
VAKPAQKADVVDGFGYDGAGISVAILEDSRIEFANPNLNNGTTRVPADANVDDHATATAGMVASQHSTQQGIAQGVTLLSANGTSYSDANMSAAMDWAAITQNADVINNSWGGNTGTTAFNVHDRHLDYIVRHYWSTVTVAAGNEGFATDRVTSPARGYNVISVGNFNAGGTTAWANDVMNGSSSTIDPSSGMEKPEVAAAGTSITSTTMNSPWTGNVGSGTSYAAPMVAGEAALLMERNSSLEIRPEAVKAIIMASALNNIEGSSRLSEEDGAGGVDMHAAFRIVDEGWWAWTSVDTNSFPLSYYVYAYAGETVRAVISWDSDPNAAYTSDPLDADIDLYVYAPNGSYQTGSLSVANSYEIVEFTAATTGNYELRINDFAFNGTTEYIGTAWWKGHNAMTPFVSTGWGTPPVGRDYFRADVGNDWHIIALRPPSTADYDLYLYGDSAFGDPDNHDLLASSTYVNDYVDYVLIDSNQAANGNYYPEVRTYSGTGTFRMEWASSLANMTSGSYGPYTMGSLDVALVWDSYQSAGIEKFYALEPISGSGDLGMALYDSDAADAGTFYRRRSQYVAYSDATGSSVEAFSRQQADSDWAGLAVFNKSGSTTFYVHVDESAPTGAINIAGGAVAVDSTLVTLNLSANDPHTGVKQMRFSGDGVNWTAWQAYAGTRSWFLPAGDGIKTVYVQFMNNANMVSATYSDTILLDMTAPESSASSPAIVSQHSFTVSWSGS